MIPVFRGSLCALLFGTLSLSLQVLGLWARWIPSLRRSCDNFLLNVYDFVSDGVQLLLLAGQSIWGALMPQIPHEFVLNLSEVEFDLMDD